MWVVARHRRDPWTIACAVLAAVLATTTMIRDAGGVVALAVLVGVVVAAAGLTRARTLLSVPLSVARLAAVRRCAGCRCSAAPSPRRARCRSSGRSCAPSASPSWPWPCSVACSPPVTPCSARGPRRWSPTSAGTPSSPAPSCWPWSPGSPSPAPTSPSTRRRSRTSPCREGRRAAHRWEWGVPVGIVVALFAGFLVAQATAMWGGHDYLERTTGLTYAEYVHQGFGQLTVATFLTVVVVALTMHVAARDTARDRLLIRLLLGRAVRAHPRRRRECALPDVALPGRLRLHRAAGLRRRVRAVAGAGRRVPARRRGAAERLVGAARGARLGRRLRPRRSPR